MAQKKLLLLVMVVVLAVGGCAARELRTQPDWVDGVSERYPDQSYLVGRGRAADLAAAQDRARADLAKVFEVTVREQRSDEQRYLGGGGLVGEAGRWELEVSRSLVTHTEQVVRGVRIAEVWRDPFSGERHALAVLARTPAAAGFRAEIGRLDEVAALEIERARSDGDLLRRIAAASRALESQVERAGLQRALQVVEASGLGVEPRWQLARLAADLEELAGRLRIKPVALGVEAASLNTALAGGVAAAGFTVSLGADAFPLHAELQLDDLGRQDGWYWQRGTLALTLYDPAGAVRGTERWSLKESAQDRESAWRRAVEAAIALLEGQLREVLLGFVAAD
ncbi:LPP20 family lipoprotein [Desulfurivibrio sp. D14AmB]|uniref:LPP20 family lipoprotein n=1 Tax=Desulfurivibrio sp. D14AmB TaxID=3374370 RepID=UPI00376F4366